jgi:sulfur-oxidizing protein SoxX
MPVMKNNNTSQILFAFVLYISFITVPVLADTSVAEGKKLALEYCVACHQFTGTNQAGSLGPPLMVMKSRFPDRKAIYDIVYDPAVAIKPHTMMPPFGRNKLLMKEEINKIIDFLYSL